MTAGRWALLAFYTVLYVGFTFWAYGFSQFGDCSSYDTSCNADRVRDGRIALALCAIGYVVLLRRTVGRWKGQ